MTLRPYQLTLKQDVYDAWAMGHRVALMRLGCGGGKTKTLAAIVHEHLDARKGGACVFAHRHRLVGQLSLDLAAAGIRHNIIASAKTRRKIAAQHVAMLGRCYYDPGALCAVASVDTLVRADLPPGWAAQVTLWVNDEGHHLVRGNKWSRAIDLFTHPDCVGLLPTATPGRSDGKGLGRHADGYADVMVEGPSNRWLVEQGYLTDYDIICPTSDVARILESLQPAAGGDLSESTLRAADRASHIVGDTVAVYRQHAVPWSQSGAPLTVIFCSGVETATDMVAAFRAANIRAEMLTGETDVDVAFALLRDYEARRFNVLVTVDIVSEGFDLPAMEVAIFARKTLSKPLYDQQFGRPMRVVYARGMPVETQAERLAAIAAGPKPRCLIIDQVGNFTYFRGGPDKPYPWTLDARDKRSSGPSDAIPLRICTGTPDEPGCLKPYEKWEDACPFCGLAPLPPAQRGSPAVVEGDLQMLDPAVLAALRGEVARVDMSDGDYARSLQAKGCPTVGLDRNVRLHREAREAQETLRATVARWGGYQHAAGLSDREIQRLFWHVTGVDVLTARTLKDDALVAKLDAHLALTAPSN